MPSYMVVPRKARLSGVKGSKGVQSYSRPTCAGVVVLLALMAFANKVPICTSGSSAQRQVRSVLAPVRPVTHHIASCRLSFKTVL